MSKDFISDEHTLEIFNNNLNIKTGDTKSLKVHSVLNSSDKATGSIVCMGGMGIEKDLHIGGNLYIESGSIYSSSSSTGVLSLGSNGEIDFSENINGWLVTFDNSNTDEDNSNVLKLDFSQLSTISSIQDQTNWIGFYFAESEHGRIRPQTSSPSSFGIEIFGTDLIDFKSTNLNFLGTNLSLSATDDLVVDSHSAYINLGNDSNAEMIIDIGGGSKVEMNPSMLNGDPTLKAIGIANDDTIVEIENSSSDSNADALRITLGRSHPGHSNNWIKLYSDGGVDLKGGVRGAEQPSMGYEGAFVSVIADGSISSETINTSGGYAQFYSGGSDFGEWFEIGDKSEWDNYKYIPEGIIVYVKNEKFYKDPSTLGVPFAVTKRALLVGNYIDSDKEGEILSFVGQVPLLTKDICNIGDYLIPSENYVRSISPDKITFSDYKKCIGTVIKEKTSTELGYVLCAIGKK